MGAERIYKLYTTDIPLKPFWLAVRTNDLNALAELCQGRQLPTFDDRRGENHLLQKAMAQKANVAVLQLLIDHGVDPHAVPPKGYYSPLEEAIAKGQLDYVDFLLGLGVDPNKDLAHHRVTLCAVSSSHSPAMQVALLERLIQHGADLNFEFLWFGNANQRFTVLDHAQHHQEVRELLQRHGAKSVKG